MSFKLLQCFHKFILYYICSSFTDDETTIEVLCSSFKKFKPYSFPESGHYQTGICQADDCFVGIDHAGQLILLCSCLSESNLLEFKSQPNSVRCRQKKKLPKKYTIEMLC